MSTKSVKYCVLMGDTLCSYVHHLKRHIQCWEFYFVRRRLIMSYSPIDVGSFTGKVFFSGIRVLSHFQTALLIIPPISCFMPRFSLVGGLDEFRGTAQPYLQRRRCFVVRPMPRTPLRDRALIDDYPAQATWSTAVTLKGILLASDVIRVSLGDCSVNLLWDTKATRTLKITPRQLGPSFLSSVRHLHVSLH